MGAQSLRAVETHFQFGENWLDYIRHVGEEATAEAERGLTKLIPREAIRGARFLDIGCGSGLHTLAALRLGAAEVVAIDIDPNSVEATTRLLDAHAPNGGWMARVTSVFDAELAELGTFDIVYSWGALHHTGAMWDAVERATRLVRAGGLLVVALYERRLSCIWWKWEKRLYRHAPEFMRNALRRAYIGLFFAALLISRRNPADYVRQYKSARGMNFHTDVHDWLGGYPYESSSPAEVAARLRALGFELIRMWPVKPGIRPFGTGCAEYTLLRTVSAEAQAES